MSQLLDALRRASKPPRTTATSGLRTPQAEQVFASLGTRRTDRSRQRLLVLAIVGFAIVVGAWTAVRWLFDGEPARPVLTRSAPSTPAPVASPPRPSVQPQVPTANPQPPPPEAPPPGRPTPEDREGQLVRQRLSGVNPPSSPEARFGQAVELHRAGEFEQAIASYRALLASGELAPQVHNNLGLLYQKRGMLTEARTEFERAVAVKPDYARAHSNLGVVLLAMGLLEDASRSFKRAATLDPRDPDPVVNLALVQKAGAQPEQARESLLHALSLAPHSPEAHYNLAVLYDRSGESARAVEHYKAFLAAAGAEYPDRAAEVRARLEAVEKLLH